MSQALYRKYRSRSLKEIVGQKPIVTALTNALNSNEISHAYLFTGPRGVGKTSIARILAFDINKIPYSDTLPLDIIEIDAASNRRIDEIRNLREKVMIAPVSSQYKVYIIDEVHMLTKEAFNALLKTLEEPPKHVIFILATTESHKLPETIISRTQQYNFKLAEPSEVVEHLCKISKKENINIEREALETLAIHSGGSLRDALSLLDQVRHSGGKEITNKQIEQILGLPPDSVIEGILGSISSNDAPRLFNILKDASDNGVSASLIAESLINKLREYLVAGNVKFSKKVMIELMRNLLDIDQSPRPNVQLEIETLQALFDNHPDTVVSSTKTVKPALTVSVPVNKVKEIIANSEHNPTIEKTLPKESKDVKVETIDTPAHSNEKVLMASSQWQNVLEELRQTHNTLYSVLRMAKLQEDKLSHRIIELEFSFPFHQKRMSDQKNQLPVHEVMDKLGLESCEIVCSLVARDSKRQPALVSASPTTTDESVVKNDNIMLDQVKNIFGNAEVLE
ncbi:DNA polymerase III subunit gamma/tau [Candidatus Saccharibacteria bacterium]|jgi:DNA polymerase-3 subunit gamma/tau|nr:DNA polymerase III subunit gamma/tau [Candidatus Saccharibacteria bacterium]MBP7834989.1 DNA polymerase III subunit gamma/tau [Candidatus Saccharibacteria bacterium]